MSIPITWQLENSTCEVHTVKNQTTCDLHGHYHFLLSLITRGEGIQTLNDREVPFSPGQMFILSPADFHKFTLKPGESCEYYSVTFSYELLDARISGLFSLNKLPMTLNLSDKTFALAKEIFERLAEEYTEGSNRIANQVYMHTMVEQLIILFLREHSEREGMVHSAFLNRTLAYLYSHFSENITVKDAAEHMGYTANYFNTVFKNSLGIPFGQCLRQLRLNYATLLLRSSDIPITEVALEAGFESSAHFSRSFREKYGKSPKEYRKEYTGKVEK